MILTIEVGGFGGRGFLLGLVDLSLHWDLAEFVAVIRRIVSRGN